MNESSPSRLQDVINSRSTDDIQIYGWGVDSAGFSPWTERQQATFSYLTKSTNIIIQSSACPFSRRDVVETTHRRGQGRITREVRAGPNIAEASHIRPFVDNRLAPLYDTTYDTSMCSPVVVKEHTCLKMDAGPLQALRDGLSSPASKARKPGSITAWTVPREYDPAEAGISERLGYG